MLSHLAGSPGDRIVDLGELQKRVPALGTAPRVTRIFAENIVRAALRAPGSSRPSSVAEATEAVAALVAAGSSGEPVEFDLWPTRLVLQDHSGIPVLADLAALRSQVAAAGGDAAAVRPALPVDLVVDHSIEAHLSGNDAALDRNMEREFALNGERYRFLRWAEGAVPDLRIVPPGGGIVHQMHLEHLAAVVLRDRSGILAPDTVLGTDSHTPMINALGVLGWGVGGVEASSAMFGHPVSVRSQPVIALRLTGAPRPGIMSTDIALTLAQYLRERGVVGTILEFVGPGIRALSVEDRSTIANMAPEYGCLAAYFPVDDAVLRYLTATGRSASHVRTVADYTRQQGLFDDGGTTPDLSGYSDVWSFDLATVRGSAAGPRRPQDRLYFAEVPRSFQQSRQDRGERSVGADRPHSNEGAIAIAAITSCTNTANPRLMIAAGVVARNAVHRGLAVPEWVKTSLAPGSRRVTDYLAAAGLLEPLARLGFDVVGYGCTTCIGNSGPLHDTVEKWVAAGAGTAAVLSGNRNFEGRIHPAISGAYLMSPPMVVAYALAGTVLIDVERDPLGHGPAGEPVYLADLWPPEEELTASVSSAVARLSGRSRDVFRGDARWHAITAPSGPCYDWPSNSSYLMPSPLVSPDGHCGHGDVIDARVLVFAPDSTTTDHISPAGRIAPDSEAGRYLLDLGVPVAEFNSYGCRRGNHHALVRGTFANVKFRNRLTPDRPGGWTRLAPSGETATVYRAAQEYAAAGVPVIVLAGRDYGMGSSRDWAAKGPRLLGVRAVLATSFERIHRSNLVGVGIVPLQFLDGDDPDRLGLTGTESFTIRGLGTAAPLSTVSVSATDPDGGVRRWQMLVRIDTAAELRCVRQGGFLSLLARELTPDPTEAED
ncbi:aconitate hydratase AcnA [Micromonospora sp. WMMC273]|uniref:aconitate hydratase AcnA n=1 Tax=Micromonospora sp. WMMC273 TaxID=3015157 RepID=UPI0022B64B40|nr:aconitate hydratase AcnA [Micromonospora sp. WMMC273]MCZ7472987.1 aconitate hydratase AcnA [Micromonospora sp. WMMC273]